MDRCQYCGRTNPLNSFECAGCGAPTMSVRELELAPFYVLTVKGILSTDARRRLQDTFAVNYPALASRLIICDDRASITALR